MVVRFSIVFDLGVYFNTKCLFGEEVNVENGGKSFEYGRTSRNYFSTLIPPEKRLTDSLRKNNSGRFWMLQGVFSGAGPWFLSALRRNAYR